MININPIKQTKHACVVAGHTHHAFTIAWAKIAGLHGVQFKTSFSCDSLSEWLGKSVSKIAEGLEAEPLFTFSTDGSEFQPQC